MVTTAEQTYDPRYVVEHEGIGRWKRGDVVPHSEFLNVKADVDRLLGLRAMRAATPLEYGQKHVDLASPEAALSYQHILSEKDQQIARLTARVAELEQQVATGPQLTQIIPPGEQAARVFEEKDHVIHGLQAQLRALTNQGTPTPAPTTPAPSPSTPTTPAPTTPAPSPAPTPTTTQGRNRGAPTG